MLPNPIISIDALNINIYMYGIMIAVGILAAFVVLFGYGKLLKIKDSFLDFIFYNALVSIAVGFGAAALFQATYNYIENPDAGFDLGGGITFIGGFIGGALCFLAIYFIFRRRLEGRLIEAVSMIPCCITVGHAFGRIGCFFAGCCYGKATDGIFGVEFHPASPAPSYPVHPTQLYEAIFLFVLFGVCTLLVLKFRFKHNLSLYFIGYGIFRFLLEYVRDDDRGALVGGISPSQFWSLGLIVTGIAVVVIWELVERKKRTVVSE
ncbi:MAG: prolipoprotein diacylglyceryl transferase [Clostridia bacterium]|nr:prolipoprotein diacylglyceryl transferase [Clostridia bacterium]